MVELICRIEVQPKEGELKSLTWVSECEIVSSWENLTDTCKITLPKSVKLRRKDSPGTIDITFAGKNAIFKRGDSVRVYAGYRYKKKGVLTDELTLRFSGYITRIDPSIPIEITAEDGMFALKNILIKNLLIKAPCSLTDILTAVIPKGIKWKTEDVTIGKFKVENVSVVEVLEYLKKEFGFSSFFLDDELYVGFQYQTSLIEPDIANDAPLFHFQHNIIESKSLIYQDAEEIKYKVKAINHKAGNLKYTVEVGDPDGEQRTLNFYAAKDADLKAIANEHLNKMKYTGFRGSFVTFLTPYMRHGMAIQLVDDVIPDRNGIYLVKAVTTTFGANGGRQEIFVDRELRTFASE